MTRREELEAEAYNLGCDDAENGEEMFASLTGADVNNPNMRKHYRRGYNDTKERLAQSVEFKRGEVVQKDHQ